MNKNEIIDALADAVAERLKSRGESEAIIISNEGRAKAQEAANALAGAFVWEYTREGGDYWMKIRDRLLQIAEDGKL